MPKKDIQEQFLDFYDKKSDAIFRHLYFRISDREKALDLMQETFERTWKYIAKGNEIDNMKSFLYRVANNLLIDEYRQKHKKTASMEVLQEKGFNPSDKKEAKESAVDNIDVGIALQYLERLPDKDRHIIVMRYIDDMQVKTIAEIMDETENNISVRMHRALKKLNEFFENNQ